MRIQIPDQPGLPAALLELMRRGRVICLRDNVFVVPEPALDVLRSTSVSFAELDRGESAGHGTPSDA